VTPGAEHFPARVSDRPRIAAAHDDDAAALAAILSGWIDETPWMPRIHTRDEDRAFCAHLISKGVRIAHNNGVPVAFLARNGADITALYVAAHHRRSGFGSALIDDAKAVSDALSLWTFQANTEARAFYDCHGFAEIARTDGDNDEGLPDVKLSWTRP